MALDSVKFTVSLVEKVTGPAKKAAGAIKNLGAKFVDLAKSIAKSGLEKAKDKLVDVAKSVGRAYLDLAKQVPGVVVSMAQLSIEAAEQQGNQLALAQSMTGSADAAKKLVDAQYKIAAGSALAQDATFDLGNRLLTAGVGANQYESTLKALADTSVIAGDQAVKPIEKLIKKSEQLGYFAVKSGDELKGSGIKSADVYAQLATDLGVSVDKVKAQLKLGKITAEQGIAATNKVLESKFGAAAAGQLTDFSVQSQKFKDNIKTLFKDVDTGPFLASMHKLLSIFDSTTGTGKALKKVLTGAMNGFFKAAGAALPYVEAFLLGVGIAALRVYISLKPSIKALGEAFGMDGSQTVDGLNAAASAGKLFGYAVTGATAGLVFTLRGVVGAVKGIKAAFNAIKHFGSGVFSGIQTAFATASNYLAGLPVRFLGLANSMIQGLVNGIEAGATAVIGAITGVVEGGVKQAKALLGINSPSKVFMAFGHGTGEGFSMGVEKAKPKVDASVAKMVSFTQLGRSANDNGRSLVALQRSSASAPATPAPSSSTSIVVEEGAVQITVIARENDQANAIAVEVKRQVATFFRQLKERAA